MAAAVPKAAVKNTGSARRRHSPSKRSRNLRRAIRANGYRSQTRLSRNLRTSRRLHNRSIPPRQLAHATRRKYRKNRTRFSPPRQGLHRRPKDLRRHRGRNTEQLSHADLRARRKAVGADYPLRASGNDLGKNHIRAARKPAGSPEETVRKIEAARKYEKIGGGNRTSRANCNGKRCRQPPNCAEFIHRSAPNYAFFPLRSAVRRPKTYLTN